MPSEVDQFRTIGLLAAHESAIADLYRAYAEKLPDRREFFESLAADEVRHARQIVGFVQQVKAGSVSINPGRFDERAILASLDHVRKQVERARKTNVSLVDALSISADIEQAMIERRFFDVIEGDSGELKQLLAGLAAATAAHRARLLQALEKERQAAG
jgi:rubrerythrin